MHTSGLFTSHVRCWLVGSRPNLKAAQPPSDLCIRDPYFNTMMMGKLRHFIGPFSVEPNHVALVMDASPHPHGPPAVLHCDGACWRVTARAPPAGRGVGTSLAESIERGRSRY